MRNRFDRQLELLNSELTDMGSLCEDAIACAVKALLTNDMELAEKAKKTEVEIDRMERDIEGLCLKLLQQQQPVARDLRLISAALKMITDMERIGDQAADVAEIVSFIDLSQSINHLHIKEIAEAAIKMVSESINAFVKRDLALADTVIAYDDVVDDLFLKTKNDLISMIAENKSCGEQALDLLMIAKYLERIADHAVNIAEWVVFSITGKHDMVDA
jgi:phosphate transport system protein